MGRFLIFVFASLLFFTGCSNRQFYDGFTNSIDSLSASLEGTATAYEHLDTTLFKEQFGEMNVHLDSLRSFGEIALFPTVVDYGYVRKRYKTFLREHPLTIKELIYSREQLTDLKHDIKSKGLDKAEVRQYFKQEKEAVAYLNRRMDSYRESILRNHEKFEKLNPKIIVLLDSLYQTKKID